MSKLKVLVAEDEKTTQRLYDAFLPDEIFEKRLIDNGEEALEAYHKWRPDIVILDIMLPVLSGYLVLKKIRVESKDQVTPIVISSSLSSRQDVTDCVKLGIQAYWRKPLEWGEVAPAVLTCYEKAFPDRSASITELRQKLQEIKTRSSKEATPGPQS